MHTTPVESQEKLEEKRQQQHASSSSDIDEKFAHGTDDTENLPVYVSNDDPFGDESGAAVQYKTLHWWQCGMLMIAEIVSLGVLSLPSAVAALGFVPAVILLIGLGLLATYTGYVIGQFKIRYPQVHNMADAGEILMGPFGRELLGGAQLLFLIFIMASHILTFSVMMNTITDHGTCTIVFGIVGLVVSLILTIPRTLSKMSWISVVSFISIFSAVMITMVGTGVESAGEKVYATVQTSFFQAFLAVANITFAYCGHVAFFGFFSELRDPKTFPKALMLLQVADITLYTVSACVIYRFAGPNVKSPSLGSTGPVVRKVAYGVAMPTIVIAGVVVAHVACKYVYVRLFRGTRHMSERSFFSIATWIGIATVLWVLAWIIAEAIPVFNNLLALITAVFGSWFTYSLSGIFWLYLNRGLYFSTWKKMALTALNLIIIVIGVTVCGVGLYVSSKAIHDTPAGASFSCANNAEY
ncbi:hypothetical protein AJ80_09644 [Polytolypa hystricis UAMH7299]|uniref:Amino acid transporter transmembrane domain-containing protein n=1 Tax=Polytolypa hystricis (strain UAMH7299) TaxID=1447883 RepID=A0A2B7WLW5_POLH7|nr:hypothetical protein AJ80_09644 [Polytolypa hystricis UAMH7299]